MKPVIVPLLCFRCVYSVYSRPYQKRDASNGVSTTILQSKERVLMDPKARLELESMLKTKVWETEKKTDVLGLWWQFLGSSLDLGTTSPHIFTALSAAVDVTVTVCARQVNSVRKKFHNFSDIFQSNDDIISIIVIKTMEKQTKRSLAVCHGLGVSRSSIIEKITAARSMGRGLVVGNVVLVKRNGRLRGKPKNFIKNEV